MQDFDFTYIYTYSERGRGRARGRRREREIERDVLYAFILHILFILSAKRHILIIKTLKYLGQ